MTSSFVKPLSRKSSTPYEIIPAAIARAMERSPAGLRLRIIKNIPRDAPRLFGMKIQSILSLKSLKDVYAAGIKAVKLVKRVAVAAPVIPKTGMSIRLSAKLRGVLNSRIPVIALVFIVKRKICDIMLYIPNIKALTAIIRVTKYPFRAISGVDKIIKISLDRTPKPKTKGIPRIRKYFRE